MLNRYGSLYYRKDGPPGSVTAHIQGDGLALEIIDRVARDFVIGPMVEKSYWHGDRSREIFNDKRGPCECTLHLTKTRAHVVKLSCQ